MSQTVNASTIDRASNPGAIVGAAQAQWFKRPEDHKFESLEKLYTAVSDRRRRSTVFDIDTKHFVFGHDKNEVLIQARAVKGVPQQPMALTHYSFGQSANILGYSAGELRKLAARPELAAEVLNYMRTRATHDAVKVMAVDSRHGNSTRLQCMTSPSYGRIWDADVVKNAQDIIKRTDGRFSPPLDWTKKKRALFASDRDVFMFFIDGGSIVDGGGERDQLHRGWFMWNSETGSKTFGIATFLFRGCCGNFGIWGAEDVRVMKVRHTSGGPERFVTEAVPALNEFVRMSAKPIEQAVRKAKQFELPTEEKELVTLFMGKGFNRAETLRARDLALVEEGQAHTMWDMYNGFTAAARMMAYAEAKVDMETRAGKLMAPFTEAA